MLPGKKFTKTLRAFRFVIELLRGHAEELNSYDEMECCFSQLCKTSVLAEHWIKTIKPLFFKLLYVCAEREGKIGLQWYVWKQMMPIFSCRVF